MADSQEVDKSKLYDQETQTIEANLLKEVNYWNNIIKNISFTLKGDVKKLVEIQADIISFQQVVIEEIRKYSLIMYKNMPTIKQAKKKRFEFYSTKYQIKVSSSTDKRGLIEADIAKFQYRIDLLDNHINFLRDTSSNFTTMNFAVKNRIQLMDILGLN